MNGIGWVIIALIAILVLALAGSRLARRSLAVLGGFVALAVFVVWLFMPVAPA